MIYLFTGPIRSGKTSSLLDWSRKRGDVGGFLTPDHESSRVLMTLPELTVYKLQTQADVQVVTVGRYRFAQSAFDTASQHVLAQLTDSHIRVIILDELGKLELRGSGHHQLIRSILSKELDKSFVIVCREDLVIAARQKFFAGREVQIIESIRDLPTVFSEK